MAKAVKAIDDVETGESAPLLKKVKRPWLGEYENQPVGGEAGNDAFYDQVALAGRTAFFATILGSTIWIPATEQYFDQGYVKYVPLAVLMIMFMMNFTFGNIMAAGVGALQGTFWPCLNIFIMRGFFPDGVTPEMTSSSPAFIAGWMDLLIFNALFLGLNCTMGTRMFAMANGTGFMLCFLNPKDQTLFSKNFQINPNGTAVMCLKMTCISCMLTMLANLLPVPFRFASADMKSGAVRVSAYLAKSFIESVEYYSGPEKTVLIEKNMKNTAVVEDQIGSLGSSIGGAWYEGFDLGILGKIRALHASHNGLLGDLVGILKALQVAMSTEDFAPSHVTIMNGCGQEAMKLVDEVGALLLTVTRAAGDGDLDASEQLALEASIEKVKKYMAALAKAFNQVRQNEPFTPIHREVLNESFFVFAISAYARKVVEYTEHLLSGHFEYDGLMQQMFGSMVKTFAIAGLGFTHWKLAFRNWCALFVGLLYAVTFDNYGGACAITLVFLMSCRIAPAIKPLLNCLVASAVASIMTAIIYQRACLAGSASLWLLPVLSFLYWWFMLYIAFSGCSMATIGLLGAALSPFTLVVRCPAPDQVSGSGAAMGLWTGIRGFMFALMIMSVAEYFSSMKTMAALAAEALDEAIVCVQKALQAVWDDQDPSAPMGEVGGHLGNAREWSAAAKTEPRFMYCKWKYDLVDECTKFIDYMKLDVGAIRHAMAGADGETGGVGKVITSIEGFKVMQDDLTKTLADARTLTRQLLDHKTGPFNGLDTLSTTEGLDVLDGVDDAIALANNLPQIKFPPPEENIETMEDDLLCQISIIFVMLEYATARMGGILGACVRRC